MNQVTGRFRDNKHSDYADDNVKIVERSDGYYELTTNMESIPSRPAKCNRGGLEMLRDCLNKMLGD